MDVSCWIHNVARMFPPCRYDFKSSDSVGGQVSPNDTWSGVLSIHMHFAMGYLCRSGPEFESLAAEAMFSLTIGLRTSNNFGPLMVDKVHMALLSMLCSFANSFYHRFRWNTPRENLTWIPNISQNFMVWIWPFLISMFINFWGVTHFFWGQFLQAKGLPGGSTRNMVITQLEVVIIVP